MKVSAKIRKSSNLVFRIILAGLVYIFLYIELKQHQEQFDFGQILDSGFQNLPYIIVAFFLMPVNWLIESLKWQFLIKKIEGVKLGSAIKAVFAGTAISIFTPNRIGDYLGRIFILKKADRIDGTIATIVGNLSQLLITLIMGGIAGIYFSNSLTQNYLKNSNFNWILVLVVIFIILLLNLLYFNFPGIEKRIHSRLGLHRLPILKHLHLLSEYSKLELLKILSFSFVRYLIYSLQFYLLLIAFDISLGIVNGMMIVFLIFLSLTIIPSIAVAELGLRALVTMTVFQIIGNQGESDLALVSATSILWLINIAMASLIGGIFIFQLKFFRKNKIDS